MKNFLVFILLCSIAYRTADVLTDIGLTQSEGQQRVVNGITSGYILVPAVCRKMTGNQRANVVSGTVQFAKSYMRTDDFKKRYTEWRMSAKPTSSTKSFEAYQQEQKGQIAELKKNLADTKVSMAKLPANTQKALQEAIRQQEKIVAEMESGNSPMLMKRETVDQLNKAAESEYQEQLKKWEDEYPADPNTLLRKRLGDFLQVSAGVDFNAKLTDRNGKKYFANSDYESQPSQWKQCFRAGSEATTTARQLAQSWLAELEKK